MTTPGDDTARNSRRPVLVIVAIAAVVVVLGVVAVLVGRGQDEPDPLDADAPGLADFTFRPTARCTYEPDRGGMVAPLEVSTRDAGRFTVDVRAVTDAGASNEDISTEHVVRVTVPFYGGQTRKRFDVVVPLTEAEYQQGYRECRWTIDPTGAE